MLVNDCESILTKGYESILGMVIRPALQAAGHEDLLCRQPDTYVHHGELRYWTMGLIEFSFSAAGEREIIPGALRHKAQSNVETNKEKTYMVRDGNIITVAPSVSVAHSAHLRR